MKQLILLLFVPCCLFSQSDWQPVDGQVFMDLIREYERSVPEGENYAMQTSYRIFSDHDSQVPVQSFEGRLLCKSGKALNVYQMGHMMVQDETLNLTIDTLEKKIILQKPDPSFFYRKTVEDYAVFLEMAEKVQQRVIGKNTLYRLMLRKGNPYRAMEFAFTDKKFLSQITIYSNQPYHQEGETPSPGMARIVLDFRDFKKGHSVDLRHFLMVSDCIDMQNTVITATAKFSGFEVIDLRN